MANGLPTPMASSMPEPGEAQRDRTTDSSPDMAIGSAVWRRADGDTIEIGVVTTGRRHAWPESG